MNTFEEFQTLAAKVPLALRNDRDRIKFPVSGLQEETGKIGGLLAKAFASGRFSLTLEQRTELQDRFADILWYVALLSREAGIGMQAVATHCIAQLQVRKRKLDPDRR